MTSRIFAEKNPKQLLLLLLLVMVVVVVVVLVAVIVFVLCCSVGDGGVPVQKNLQ
jgi:flagellar basal body-associated protein FliL